MCARGGGEREEGEGAEREGEGGEGERGQGPREGRSRGAERAALVSQHTHMRAHALQERRLPLRPPAPPPLLPRPLFSLSLPLPPPLLSDLSPSPPRTPPPRTHTHRTARPAITRQRSRPLSQLSRQFTPRTKNGHAPPLSQSRKNCILSIPSESGPGKVNGVESN